MNSEKAFLCVEELGHPYLDLRPNSVSLPETILITGANMGGKSTLLKSVCHAVILAQIGAYVPCKSYRATPLQKLGTRLGAYDSILEAKSTFQTEMEETVAIINGIKSQSSLVVIDELGRGTSTYDGMAIAASVLDHIKNKALCLFTTHYDLRAITGVQ